MPTPSGAAERITTSPASAPTAQRWITYRDADTFAHVVEAGPLYPLNSLMLHGLIFAKHAKNLDRDPGGDFDAEIRSYFGTGTQLQEMYVTPALLSAGDLGSPRGGREVVARQRRDALRHALGRRRSVAARRLRLGGVVAGPGHPDAAQPGRERADFRRRSGGGLGSPAASLAAHRAAQSLDPRAVPPARRARGGPRVGDPARTVRGANARRQGMICSRFSGVHRFGSL